MTAPLLATKLYIPPIRPELVPRPRLIQRLDKGLSLETLKEEIRITSSLWRFIEYSTLALVRIAQDRPGDALSVLRPLLRAAEDAG